ncbi:MAG: hypothetical protein OM95_03410 [Bdellovibrio sp. ArHS]|uniref:ZrgA family zinc uptake protein n=1 Tax=Bdellovibrio sp. ArHS TaxID=1569284 RepID=UPI0005831656|nr:DUF2796 domain-containing protein [Bdellovibrio sp. ArHS]KHD89426.1 MAG: hypothetical protein OM95_03410 [Bdellovibrio sp. ArHS]
MIKILLLSTMLFAAREHGAHVHGAGKVSVAFDGKNGKIELHVPAEAIMGFEHQAKTKADKQKKEKALAKLEEKIAEMIVLDPALKCAIKKDIFEVNQQDSHAEIEAEFNVTCATPVAGSTITFNFTKQFSRLKKVQVDVLADGVQKSLQVQKNGDSVELK